MSLNNSSNHFENFDPQDLRSSLVALALEWEHRYGTGPAITSTLSEYDAALLVGLTPRSFGAQNQDRTAVTKGFDFIHNDLRYQIKANRPSGKPGSFVTKVSKANNYLWDKLIWLVYDREYNLLEAYQWDVIEYQKAFDSRSRLSPANMRKGLPLHINSKIIN